MNTELDEAGLQAEAAAALRGAADKLDEKGWVWRQWEKREGPMCALQALRDQCGVLHEWEPGRGRRRVDWSAMATRAGLVYKRAAHELMSCIGVPTGRDHHVIPMWNDEYGRTASEVKQALRNCADRVEDGAP